MKEQEKWNRKNVMEDHLLDLPFWGPYWRFVKGEMARSALEKASYMDIVYGCPLDAIVSFMEGSGKLLLSASFLD